MANGIKFEIKGLKELQQRFKQMPQVLSDKIDGEIERSAQVITLEAKSNAPKNVGKLAAATQYTGSNMNYTISAYSKYAHIVEFGSKKKVNVPAELQEYAATKKGQPTGGNFKEFVQDIEKWVTRKGIGATYNVNTRRKNRQSKADKSQIAYAIAMSIAKNGVAPHPFLFPAFFKERPILLKNVEKVINNA